MEKEKKMKKKRQKSTGKKPNMKEKNNLGHPFRASCDAYIFKYINVPLSYLFIKCKIDDKWLLIENVSMQVIGVNSRAQLTWIN